MKKSIAIGVIVALVIGLIAAIPVFAKSENTGGQKVFEAEIVQAGQTSRLDYGEVCFRDNGSYQVELQGIYNAAQIYPRYYDVYMLWGRDGWPVNYALLGQFEISEAGESAIIAGYLSEVAGVGSQVRFAGLRVVIMGREDPEIPPVMPPSSPDSLPEFVSTMQLRPTP